MQMKIQKGFTLIELMVVIVIIGILSALAVPKMFGTSAKAKAAEAPNVLSNWETLQSAYTQEAGRVGNWGEIGFRDPTPDSKWFDYTEANTHDDITIVATARGPFGDCSLGDTFESGFTLTTDIAAHYHVGNCANYTPNF
jgi:type IV pilus assembly protein PilA